jgi:hypothetical protein
MKKKYTITSVDTEKSIGKVKRPYMRITFSKSGKEITVFKLIHINEISKLTSLSETSCFPPIIREKTKISPLSSLNKCYIGNPRYCNKSRKGNNQCADQEGKFYKVCSQMTWLFM